MRFSFPVILLLILLTGCRTFHQRDKDLVYQEVFYLTTRKDSGSADPRRRYTGIRGDAACGAAMVAIDARARLSPYAQPQANHILQQAALLRKHPLQQLLPLADAQFFDGIRGYAGQPGRTGDILIFIHGYKRTFGHCIENAAQLRYELAFAGPVIAFAWPSTDAVSGYMADRENLLWSAPELRRLVARLNATVPGARIHIVAHSLGTRAVVELLKDLRVPGSGINPAVFGDIVLLAPDIDRDLFVRDAAELLAGLSTRVTLYVSSHDIPLMASAAVFEYPRLGDASDGVPVIPGIETIDVSDAITFMDGHGYYESDPDTIADLYHLIHEGRGARQRPNLVEVETTEGPYWRLTPPAAP